MYMGKCPFCIISDAVPLFVWEEILKMKYETPYIEIVDFGEGDVITWSSLEAESTGDGDWKDFGDLFG